MTDPCKNCDRRTCPTLTMPPKPPRGAWTANELERSRNRNVPEFRQSERHTRKVASKDCAQHRVDWRARALAAEVVNARLRAENAGFAARFRDDHERALALWGVVFQAYRDLGKPVPLTGDVLAKGRGEIERLRAEVAALRLDASRYHDACAALDEIGHTLQPADAIRDLEAQRRVALASNALLRAEVARLAEAGKVALERTNEVKP